MASDIPFAEIQDKCVPVVESLCRRWLGAGHKTGGWWVANVPWRNDKTASLGVSFKTGRFQDFGADGKRGDMIKLFSLIYGTDMVDAADAVAQIVGHPFRKARRS